MIKYSKTPINKVVEMVWYSGEWKITACASPRTGFAIYEHDDGTIVKLKIKSKPKPLKLIQGGLANAKN